MSAGEAPVAHRTRWARRATSLLFAWFGVVTGLWGVYIPTVRDRTGASIDQVGLALLLVGVGAFAAMTLCSHVIGRLGSRAIAVVGTSALGMSALGPAFATTPAQLMLATPLLGIAMGLTDVSQNAQAVDVERAYPRPIMASFHAIFSLGGLCAAAIGALTLALEVDVRAVFTTAAATGLVVAWWSAPRLNDTRRPAGGERTTPRAPRWTPRLLLLGSVAFALLLTEGVAFDWSTVYLRDVVQAGPAVAPAGFAAVTVSMVVVRLMSDRLVARVGARRFVWTSTSLAITGLVVVTVATTPAAAAVGWAVLGVGLAGCIPLVFSTAGGLEPAASDALVSRVASFGYMGLIAGPSVIGFLAPHVGLRGAMVVPILCCAYVCATVAITFEPGSRPGRA